MVRLGELFDRRRFRVWFGFLVVVPLSVLFGFYALNATFWGALLSIAIITDPGAEIQSATMYFVMLVAGIFGLLGIVGACTRIYFANADLVARPKLRII